ncbi:MAG: exosortase/archaeosortase family protein [Candidatus Aenigmarchaeota archaeon]|nr:exosortase/archaeosortase family protein [Candidatus Aenigmarchaeota archaeon]
MAKLRLNEKQRRLWVVLNFLARVTLLSIPLYAILWANPSFDFLQYAVRDHSLFLAKLFGVNADVDGFYLGLSTIDGPFTIDIAADCTGWKSAVAYLALVIAVPSVSNRKRLIGLIGIPIIYLANVTRIAFLLFVLTNAGFSYFRIFHEYLWKIGLSAIVLLTWYLWLTKIAGRVKPEKFISY